MSEKMCARCLQEPRTPGQSYCRGCARIKNKESTARNQTKKCSTCHAAPRAPGQTRCFACNRVGGRKSKIRHQHRTCSTCHEAPRSEGHSQCPACRAITKANSRYALTPLEHAALLTRESCDICSDTTSRLVIDHDHSTGLVKGRVCDRCNHRLGRLDQDGWLNSAYSFVERPDTGYQYNQLHYTENRALRETLCARPCEICGEASKPRGLRKNPRTGYVLGVLCHACASQLYIVEDTTWLLAALEYRMNPPGIYPDTPPKTYTPQTLEEAIA